MKLFKTIFSGVLLATAVSTLVAMDGPKPEIDCLEINNKEALVNALKHHGYIEAGFSVEDVWDGIPECANDIWKRLDPLSKKSILDAHIRINRSTTLETPGAPRSDSVRSRDEQLREALRRKLDQPNHEPDRQLVNSSFGKQVKEWVAANKWKTAGIGILTLGALDALQAYVRTDKATFKDSDFKGKLELIRRQMVITRSYNGALGLIKSYCA